MADQYFNDYSAPGADDVRKAITEALAEPAPLRLSEEERQTMWDVACKSVPGWRKHLTYAEAIEARIFGDKE
jgi:hypothetical protein